MNAPTSQAVLAPTVKLLIGGQFVESKTTEWRNVVNPATQQVLARVPFATADEINAAVASAKEAFKTGKTIRELCTEKRVLPPDVLEKALDPFSMTEPHA